MILWTIEFNIIDLYIYLSTRGSVQTTGNNKLFLIILNSITTLGRCNHRICIAIIKIYYKYYKKWDFILI